MTSPKYIIISPVRNEAEYLPLTVASIASQTIRPALWVIVDDGSTDGTGDLAQQAASREPYIEVVRRQDRGFRQAGGGVMEAFYDGFARIGDRPWDFLVKLDGDVSFAPDYFERCFGRFEADPRLGIAGGTVYIPENGALRVESTVDPAFHVRGATKIYRNECWREIGGLIRAPGWDTVDELKANMLGWRTLTCPEIHLTHHRPTGDAYGSWKDWVKNGRANYVAGYHPVFMTAKCVRRIFHRPYLLGALGLLAGYFGACFRRVERVPDKELLKYFRHQQINRLLFRKSLWGRTTTGTASRKSTCEVSQ